MNINEVTSQNFSAAVEAAMVLSPKVNEFLSHGVDYSSHKVFLTEDSLSGFAISPEGDLQSVFSLAKGRGEFLVREAVKQGAETLDCFDGYLPSFYQKMGFVEIKREANWTEGGPDVVYMAR